MLALHFQIVCKTMQQKCMARVTRYFDCWGHCTQFEAIKRHKLFHIILTLINGWLIIVFLNKPTDDTLAHLNDVLKLGSFLFVCCFSASEAYVKCKRKKIFWLFLEKIEWQFRSDQSLQLHINYLFILGFIVVSTITASAYYTCSSQS